MGFWQPVTNLRANVAQNPPLVTFFLCLFTLAVSLIGLRAYGFAHKLPNPDIKDWNHLLSSLSQFRLCLKGNTSSDAHITPLTTEKEHTLRGRPFLNYTKTAFPITHLNVKVPLVVAYSSDTESLEGLGLHTSFLSEQLGLVGNESFNVTLQLFSKPKGNDTFTCLTISGPTCILPLTLLPPECPVNETIVSLVRMEPSKQSPTELNTCYSVQAKHDRMLTVMLDQEQQAVAGRHLLEVGAFLLGVCLLLFLSATLMTSVTACRHKENILDQQSEPLIDPTVHL